MKQIIKLEKEDINTKHIGINFEVMVAQDFSLVFSKEALEELISDYKSILDEQAKEGEAKVVKIDFHLPQVENVPIDTGDMSPKKSMSERYCLDDSKERKAITENFDILNNIIERIKKLDCDKIIVSPMIASTLLQSFELNKRTSNSNFSTDPKFIGHIDLTMVYMDPNMQQYDGSIIDYDTKEVLFAIPRETIEKLF